jgi:hypothetical protein
MRSDVKRSDDGSGTAEINDTPVNTIVEFVVSFWSWTKAVPAKEFGVVKVSLYVVNAVFVGVKPKSTSVPPMSPIEIFPVPVSPAWEAAIHEI